MLPGFSSVVASVCVATAMDFFRRKMKVAIVCLLSSSLAIHDYVLESANNNFTGFKVG